MLTACLRGAGSSNQQLAASNADLQRQLGSYEAFVELCVQELRRLSGLANEPFQLPAIPAPAQASSHLPAPTLARACRLRSHTPKNLVCTCADATSLTQLTSACLQRALSAHTVHACLLRGSCLLTCRRMTCS